MNIISIVHILRYSPRLSMMVTGVLVIYLLAWQFGICRTITLLTQYAAVSNTSKIQREHRSSPEDLVLYLDELDNKMGCSDLPGDDIRQAILDRLSQTGRHCPFTMVDIPASYSYKKKEYTVMVNTFIITGNYGNLIRLMYSMDTASAPGNLISTRLYIHRNFHAAAPELRLALYFQHLMKNHETQ